MKQELIAEKLGKDDVDGALGLLTEDEATRGAFPHWTRKVFGAARVFLERKGNAAREESSELCKRLLLTGEAWCDKQAKAEADAVEGRLWWAESLVLNATRLRRAGDAGWLDAMRDVARQLVAWQEGKAERRRVRVRAVEILGDAALVEGAPSDELLSEAETLAKGGKSPAALAMARFARVRVLYEQSKKKESAAELQFFEEMRPKLDEGELDRDLASVYNDVALFVAERKDLQDLPFKLETRECEDLTLEIPVSWRWEIDSRDIQYWAEPGVLRYKLRFFVFPPGIPRADGTPRPKNPGQRVSRWNGWAWRGMTKASRPRKRGGKFNSHLPKAASLTCRGIGEDGRRQIQTAHAINARKTKGAVISILAVACGKGADRDPAVRALMASIREEKPISLLGR